MLEEKLLAVNIHIKEKERIQINNLTFHLRHWKKEQINFNKQDEGNNKDSSENEVEK